MSAEEPTDVARLRRAFASLRDDGTSEPVDSERIFEALHGDMGPEERHAIVEQLLTNPAAAESWRLAREMSPEPAADAGRGGAQDSGRPAWRWMSVAAAVLLVAGVGWQLAPWRQTEEPVYRGVESRAIASALPPGSDLSRAQPVLRWSGIDGARYRVRVLTADLQLIEESAEGPTTEYTLGPRTLARIAPGAQILWQVDARIPGEVVVTSPTFSNRVP